MDTLRQDLRFALRELRKKPAFTLAAILTLALGIGANSALWTVVDGVLLKPLPYPEPDRLVRVFDSNETFPRFALSPANFLDFRADLEGTAELAAFLRRDAEWTAGENSERLMGMVVTSGFFRVLGFEPVLGRGFERAVETEGNDRVAVVSDRFWRRALGGDPAAVGSEITFDGEAHTVIGVLPPGVQHVGGAFRSLPHGEVVDVWRPRAFRAEPRRSSHFLNGLARLAPGVGLEEARARSAASAARLAEEYPQSNGGWTVALVPLEEEILGDVATLLVVLFGAVFLILLIAAVNVAGLLLARAASRRPEIAVRRALGAGNGRLARQLITESLVLALAGGLAGLAVGALGIELLRWLEPPELPRLHMIGLDPRGVAFTALLTLATGLLFSCAPLLESFGVDLRSALGSADGRAGRRQTRLRGGLVVCQVAVAILLLTGAALFARSLLHLRDLDPGFDPEGVLTARVNLPQARYGDGDAQADFYARLVPRLEALPGVVAAGAGSDLPWSGYDENLMFAAEGRTLSDDPEDPRVRARFHQATPGYFASLGIPLEGREFTFADDSEAPGRVIVNRSLAELAWPEESSSSESVVGRRITFNRVPTRDEQWWTIVGVIDDVADAPSQEEVLPSIYFPYAQAPWWRELVLALRAEVEPASLVESVRREIRAIDPDLPLAMVGTLSSVAERSFATPRFLSFIVGSFALVAVSLAAVGLFGLLAFAVRERRREIAVRIVVGARGAQVVRQMMREGLMLAVAGIGLGTAGALAAGRHLAGLLHGVTPHDPVVLAVTIAVLALVAVAASWLPARRASRVEPARVLRGDG